MTEGVHRAASADGTSIAARFCGDGPPLVFVNGGGGDGDGSWATIVPLMADRFTCLTMSTRGRGLSGDADDHSCERLVEDVVAITDSLGGPVGIVGHSSGASLALAASARSTAISAAVLYEPTGLNEHQDGETVAIMERVTESARAASDRGENTEAARRFVEGCPFFNETEALLMARLGVFDFMAEYVSMWLDEIPEYLRATDELAVEQVTAPVLLLHGEQTHPLFTRAVHHFSTVLADARAIQLPGVGHMARCSPPTQWPTSSRVSSARPWSDGDHAPQRHPNRRIRQLGLHPLTTALFGGVDSATDEPELDAVQPASHPTTQPTMRSNHDHHHE